MFFKKSNNSLTIYMPKETDSKMGDDNENSNFSGLFANMIQTELKLQFERKVKKSNFKKIAFSDDKKSATIRLSMADFKVLKGKKITFQFEK